MAAGRERGNNPKNSTAGLVDGEGHGIILELDATSLVPQWFQEQVSAKRRKRRGDRERKKGTKKRTRASWAGEAWTVNRNPSGGDDRGLG